MDDATLEHARAAFAAQAWEQAHRAWSSLPADELAGDDLHGLAVVAYLVGQDESSERAFEAAHGAHLADGDEAAAARDAFWLGMLLHQRGEHARAGGWLGRAERLLADATPCAEHGLLLIPRALYALDHGDARTAHEEFRAAGEIADTHGDPDLQALARLGLGQSLVALGDLATGIRLLDEVMVAVRSGEVSPVPAGIAYCAVIEVCRDVHDVARAREWTDALSAWCEAHPELVPYRGQCLVHRSEVLQLRGRWSEAMEEADRARDRLADPARPALALATYQQGELHRLRGELEAAEDAYAEAAALGHGTQPGLARLRLVQGQPALAAAALRRALAEAEAPARRVELLAPLVEALLATGDLAGARTTVDELVGVVTPLHAPTLTAVADHVRGAVLLAEGHAADALAALRAAWEAWSAVGAPYEAARVRVLLGLTCHRMGDGDGARLEWATARSVLQQLDASPDLDRLDRIAGSRGATAAPGGLSDREVEVLRLVARGRTNRSIAQELVISEHTVARHLQNIFTKLDVSSRTAAAAFAFERGLVPGGRGQD